MLGAIRGNLLDDSSPLVSEDNSTFMMVNLVRRQIYLLVFVNKHDCGGPPNLDILTCVGQTFYTRRLE